MPVKKLYGAIVRQGISFLEVTLNSRSRPQKNDVR